MNEAPCSWRVSTYSMEDLGKASISRMFSSPGIPKTWVTPSFSRHSTINSAVERDCSAITTSLVARALALQPAVMRLRVWSITSRPELTLAGMTGIQPELWIDRAAEAVAFYQAAFGA